MAYYLFSSVLQADAAVIGLGIVLVVYKLQSNENRLTTAHERLQSLNTYAVKVSTLARQIIRNADASAKGSALRQYLNHEYYEELELLAAIPLRAEEIKRDAFSALRFVSVHMAVSALALVLVPLLQTLRTGYPLAMLSFLFLLSFWAVVMKIQWTARRVVFKSNEFDLKSLSPEIYEAAHQ